MVSTQRLAEGWLPVLSLIPPVGPSQPIREQKRTAASSVKSCVLGPLPASLRSVFCLD